MSELTLPHQMSNRDKFKALLKQVAVSAAMNAVPGTVQFIAEVGHKVYELWLASPPEERAAYQAGAGELSETERDLATAELERCSGMLLAGVLTRSLLYGAHIFFKKDSISPLTQRSFGGHSI